MLVYLIVLMLLVVSGMQTAKKDQFFSGYLSKEQTTAINGIFVLIVFLSHASTYVELGGPLDDAYSTLKGYLRQLIVASFLFYSGYGCYESFQHKENYFKGFLKKRVLKTLVNFAAALLLYVIVNLIFRFHYSAKEYLLCWIGWEGLGNSNWFMFVILALYLLVFLAMKTGLKGLTVKMFLLAGILWTALFFGRHASPWWYNTLITFPLGILFSDVKPKLDPFLRRQVIWFSAFLALAILYLGLHHLIGDDRWGLVSSLFCLLIILASMKVRIDNPILTWLGLNAFAIYILQRLPMIVLSHFGLERFPLYFTILIFAITLLTAGGFTKLTGMIDRKLFTAK